MDQGSLLLHVCVMMICLLGAARCSNGGEVSCPCPEIPQRDLTELPSASCRQINSSFRYTCIAGYVRQVGTSNLTKCKRNTNGDAEWTTPTLTCKRDPKIKTTRQPLNATIAESHTDIPIITATVTASTSLQTTPSFSISAPVTAETGSTEPTSAGLQVLSDQTSVGNTYFVTETKATDAIDGTTSTSTTIKPPPNSTVDLLVSNPTKLDDTATAMISLASLVTICALIGISFACYRKKRRNGIQQHTVEEQMPMNTAPPELAK